MKKKYIPIILLLAIAINGVAQNKVDVDPVITNTVAIEKSSKELMGDKYAFRYSYDKAIDSYLNSNTLTIEGQRNLAESYCKIGQNEQAENIYLKLLKSLTGVVPEDYFNYAMILKSNGKYDEAIKSLDKFNDLKPEDLRAKDYDAHKLDLPDLLKDDGKYKLLHLDANTDAQDFGPSYYKNKIVFTSTRSNAKMVKRKYNLNGKPFLNIYVADVKENQLINLKVFDNKLDNKMHDGPTSFNKEGTYMAFTKNHFKDKSIDKIVELQIYFSNNKDGKWAKSEPFEYNNEAYSVGHPCLSASGNSMYFISDMPGGFGGTDIYKTTKNEKGEWTKPENLGDKINTEGDELFPFYEENIGVLLFSSNGRFGLGGQDIFISTVNGSNYSKVHNAGSPLNSQYDDFSGIVDGKTNMGYFSSNRITGSGDDDIYSVEFLKGIVAKKNIEGIAKDINGVPIPNTFITLLDENGNILDTLTTNDQADFNFSVDSDKFFKLIGQKKKYSDGEKATNTFSKEMVVIADVVLLTKKEIIAKKIEVETNLGEIMELNTIFFDLDKYSIRPDAVVELDKIVQVMNDYPNLIVELKSYTDCRETNEYNMALSERRAKTTAWYIKKRISNPERISGKGYGETKLANECSCDGIIVSDCSENEHQKNRRTDFTIVKPASVKN